MSLKYYFIRLSHYYKKDGLLKTIERIFVKILVGIWVMIRWRNPVREILIRGVQRRRLSKLYSPTAKSLVLFVTQGFNRVNGGILSINSIYNETCKLKEIHGAEVVMCTMPGEYLLLKHTKYENQTNLYSFAEVLSYFLSLDRLLIHIPELYVRKFIENDSVIEFLQQKKVNNLYMNILLQNIDFAPSRESVEKLKRLGVVTCTTAHEAYSTPETQEKLGCQLHWLSTHADHRRYSKRGYSEKENLMVISPDPHELKATVLELIARQFPQLRLQIIWNLTFEEYKKLILKAKWSITFGEGLDGYFIHPIFSGGISFAAYNIRYFTEDFKTLRTVYQDYESLIEKICLDIRELDNEDSYTEYQRKQLEKINEHYNYEQYVENITSFYLKYYSKAN